MRGSAPRGRSVTARLAVSLAALALVAAMTAFGACGDDDDDDGGDEVSLAELKSQLPAPDDVGIELEREFESDHASDLVVLGINIPEDTVPSELSEKLEDAGFQGAAGSQFVDSREARTPEVRIAAAQFDSEEGALEARDVLHAEDLKQPCAAACVVSPEEYQLEEIADAPAVHLVPNPGKPPPGLTKFEAYHAEFVIGPQLYVVQMGGEPGGVPSADFDEIVSTVYESASGA